MSHFYPFFYLRCLRNKSEVVRLVNNLAADHGQKWFHLSYFPLRDREVIAVQNQQVGILAALQGA